MYKFVYSKVLGQCSKLSKVSHLCLGWIVLQGHTYNICAERAIDLRERREAVAAYYGLAFACGVAPATWR